MKFTKLVKAEKVTLSEKEVLDEFAKLQKALDNFRVVLRNDFPFIDDECSEIRRQISMLYSKLNK